MLVCSCFEFTRPKYSSISLGLLPAASIRVGAEINLGIVNPSLLNGFEFVKRAGDLLRLDHRQTLVMPEAAGALQARTAFDFLVENFRARAQWPGAIGARTAIYADR